jgi:hypothetical protein
VTTAPARSRSASSGAKPGTSPPAPRPRAGPAPPGWRAPSPTAAGPARLSRLAPNSVVPSTATARRRWSGPRGRPATRRRPRSKARAVPAAQGAADGGHRRHPEAVGRLARRGSPAGHPRPLGDRGHRPGAGSTAAAARPGPPPADVGGHARLLGQESWRGRSAGARLRRPAAGRVIELGQGGWMADGAAEGTGVGCGHAALGTP